MLKPVKHGITQIKKYWKANTTFCWALTGIVLLGIIARVWGGLDTLLFTYDQSRDAFIARGIMEGQFKIVGPASDIPGMFHGPLFYYLIAPFYWFGGGDPRVVLVEMIVINLLTLIPLLLLTQKLFNDKRITIITAIFFVVSYEAVSYGRWISNPSLSVPAMAITYTALWMAVKKEKWAWPLLGLGLGLSIQSEIFLVYLLGLSAIVLVGFKVKPYAPKLMGLGVAILAVLLSSFAVAELKFRFQGAKGMLKFFLDQEGGTETFAGHLANYYGRFSQLFQYNLTPSIPSISLVLGLILIGYIIYSIVNDHNNRRALIYSLILLFSHVMIFLVSGVNATFINVGVGMAVIILAAFSIVSLRQKTSKIAYGLVLVVVALNLIQVARDNGKGSVLFQVQHNMRLSDGMDIITATYDQAGGRPFGVAAITNPLFVPTTWAYLYDWYSREHRVSLPFYRGNAASEYAGDNVFPRSDEKRAVEFLIQEPQPSIPDEWINKIMAEEILVRGAFTKKQQFGTFTLYTREAQ